MKDRIEDEVFQELVQEANDYAMQFEQEEPYPYLVGTLNYIVNNSSVCKMLLSQNGSKNFCDRLVQIEEDTVLTEWIEPLKTQYDAVLCPITVGLPFMALPLSLLNGWKTICRNLPGNWRTCWVISWISAWMPCENVPQKAAEVCVFAGRGSRYI